MHQAGIALRCKLPIVIIIASVTRPPGRDIFLVLIIITFDYILSYVKSCKKVI